MTEFITEYQWFFITFGLYIMLGVNYWTSTEFSKLHHATRNERMKSLFKTTFLWFPIFCKNCVKVSFGKKK